MRFAGNAAGALVAAVIGLACGGEAGDPLAGEWTGADTSGHTIRLVFGEQGAALWIMDRVPGVQDTLELSYLADTTETPARLDLRGFMEGPLAGMVLYGIYEMRGRDTLRVDFEPGVPGQSVVRPQSFTGSTVTLTRAR